MRQSAVRRVLFALLTLILVALVCLEGFVLYMRFARGVDYQASIAYLGELARFEAASEPATATPAPEPEATQPPDDVIGDIEQGVEPAEQPPEAQSWDDLVE